MMHHSIKLIVETLDMYNLRTDIPLEFFKYTCVNTDSFDENTGYLISPDL